MVTADEIWTSQTEEAKMSTNRLPYEFREVNSEG